jgi:hypothetical protein
VAAPATSGDGDVTELGALLDIDSFEAVRAQGALSSEGSVDGYDSEASFPTSPRMRLMVRWLPAPAPCRLRHAHHAARPRGGPQRAAAVPLCLAEWRAMGLRLRL